MAGTINIRAKRRGAGDVKVDRRNRQRTGYAKCKSEERNFFHVIIVVGFRLLIDFKKRFQVGLLSGDDVKLVVAGIGVGDGMNRSITAGQYGNGGPVGRGHT